MNGLSSIIQKNRLYVLELKIMRSPTQKNGDYAKNSVKS